MNIQFIIKRFNDRIFHIWLKTVGFLKFWLVYVELIENLVIETSANTNKKKKGVQSSRKCRNIRKLLLLLLLL
jgi:hypothetical protein